MGLDLSFDLKPALDAGLQHQLHIEPGFEGLDEPEYILNLVALPDTDGWRDADMYIGKGSSKARCMVRANKWGSFYEPLTEFLKKHDIQWIES